MLARLGYEIVTETQPIQCQIEAHGTKTHGIDFLGKPSSRGLCKPIASPDGLTLFSCRHADVGDSDIKELQDINECLKLTDDYKDLSGAVLVTAAWVSRDFYDKFKTNEGLYLWDQARCHLFGSLARQYMRLRITSEMPQDKTWPIKDLETIVTLSLAQGGVGYFGIFNYYEVGIFYEGNARFNLDLLRYIFQDLRRSHVIGRFSLNRLIIHTTRGFTADFSLKMNEILRDFTSSFVGIKCSPSDLYDHSNPWFPSYMR